MSTSILTEWATSYAEAGWAVFPVHGITDDGSCTCADAECKNRGKHPVPSNGVTSASSVPFSIENRFSNPDHNIGLATGKPSKVWVLDIDGPEGEASLAALEVEHGKLPDTALSRTGRGRHLFFKMPGNKEVRNSASKVGKKIDVRGTGGYVILPPSRHMSMTLYAWERHAEHATDAPDWLLKLVIGKPKAAPGTAKVMPLSADEGEIRDALGSLDPDLTHDDWVAIGMAVHSAGLPMSVWDDWSARGDKYDAEVVAAKWCSFTGSGGITIGTLKRMAEEAGWKSTRPHPAQVLFDNLDVDTVIPFNPIKPPQDVTKFPFDPAKLPGLIGETVRWILRSSTQPQPELAMLAVLSTAGAICGQKYALRTLDTRTNLYTVGLAETGAGKNKARSAMKLLLREIGCADLIGDDRMVSETGFIRSVEERPCQVAFIDEFGLFLKTLTDERAGSHIKQIARTLTEFYSTSNGTFTGATYASKDREKATIICPNYNIYGTSTMSTYQEALQHGQVESGELNRYVIVPALVALPKKNYDVEDTVVPTSLKQAWADMGRAKLPEQAGDLVGVVTGPNASPIKPVLVDYDLDDLIACDTYVDKLRVDMMDAGSRYHALWARYTENAIKIAMLFAVARDNSKPRLTADDWKVGRAIVGYSAQSMAEIAMQGSLSTSEGVYEETLHQTILATIHKRNGQGATTTDITSDMRQVPTRKRTEAVAYLVQQGHIRCETVQGKGRPVSKFFAD